MTFFIGMMPVFADCSDCNPTDCESCGCVLDSNSNVCVYSNYTSDKTSCGDGLITNIPSGIPKVVSIVYTIIQVAVPILLVILGSMDLMKSLTSSKEDEIKKGQQMFVKRLISAAIVFFVFVLVKFVISLSADNGAGIMECAECFIRNVCD